MTDTRFKADVRVTRGSSSLGKCTISMTPYGDLDLVQSTHKLTLQVLRSLVNDSTTAGNILNVPISVVRNSKALFTSILRNMRETQIQEVSQAAPTTVGYFVYRRSTLGTELYTKVSPTVTDSYTDYNLFNGTSYDYAFTAVDTRNNESSFFDFVTVTPASSPDDQLVVVGNNVAAFSEDQSATFYFNYPKKFMASELLDEIVSIDLTQDDAEPRRLIVEVKIKDLLGNIINISSSPSQGA